MASLICTKCVNWDKRLRDCSLDHVVYLSKLGVYFTPKCDDFDDSVQEDEIDEMLNGTGYGDEEDYSEPEDEGYEPEEPPRIKKPINKPSPFTNRNRIDENRNESRREVRNTPQEKPRGHFAEDAKRLIEEKQKRNEKLNKQILNEETEYDPNDPLDELLMEARKNALADINKFKHQVEAGAVDPNQLQREIEELNKANYKLDDIDIEAEKEAIRSKINITGLNEAAKKKAGK